jgi:hypothetical protein
LEETPIARVDSSPHKEPSDKGKADMFMVIMQVNAGNFQTRLGWKVSSLNYRISASGKAA